MTGRTYGLLTAVKVARPTDALPIEEWPRDGHLYWVFRCHCGGIVIRRGSDVRFGKITNCGCVPRGRPLGKPVTAKYKRIHKVSPPTGRFALRPGR